MFGDFREVRETSTDDVYSLPEVFLAFDGPSRAHTQLRGGMQSLSRIQILHGYDLGDSVNKAVKSRRAVEDLHACDWRSCLEDKMSENSRGRVSVHTHQEKRPEVVSAGDISRIRLKLRL